MVPPEMREKGAWGWNSLSYSVTETFSRAPAQNTQRVEIRCSFLYTMVSVGEIKPIHPLKTPYMHPSARCMFQHQHRTWLT